MRCRRCSPFRHAIWLACLALLSGQNALLAVEMHRGKTAAEWLQRYQALDAQRAASEARGIGVYGKSHRELAESRQALLVLKSDTVPLIVAELNQGAAIERWASLLGDIGPAAVSVLAAHVRRGGHAVMHELYRQGKDARAALPALVDALADDGLADEAEGTITHIGLPPLPEALPEFVRYAQDPSAPLRQRWAVTLIGSMGRDGQRAVDALTELLAKAEDPVLHRAVLHALGEVGGPRAADVLLQSFGDQADRTDWVPAIIVESLGKTGEAAAIPLLVEQLARRDRHLYTVLPAFANFGAEALPQLLPLLKAKDRHDRENAARAVVLLKDYRGALPQLKTALNDPDPLVRAVAAFGLGRLGPAALPALDELIELVPSDTCPVDSISRIAAGDPASTQRVLPVLISVLRDRDAEGRHRESAAKGLARLGPAARSALPALEQTMEEFHRPDSAVRQAAEDAIRRICSGAQPPTR